MTAEIRTPSTKHKLIGVSTLLASALSNQVGAALGALAFPVIGTLGVVSIRQLIAAGVLVGIARPRFRTLTRAQWWPILLLGAVFGMMNICLYAAIDRLGLALAVTLEFLGPLGVALAMSRRWLDVVCGIIALAGVVLLTDPQPSSDFTGIALGLAAAGAWAAYILLNRVVGARVPGLRGTSAAATVSAILWTPIALVVLVSINWAASVSSLLLALACGVLSSAVPYIADLITLRRLPPALFGVLMSINPVYAALVGLIILHQRLAANEWAGIAVIVAVNALITVIPGRQHHR
jgi:inner membrane transporter RhtA